MLLYIFVEGPDDERFFKACFKGLGDNLKVISYANKKPDYVTKYINSLLSIKSKGNDVDYLLFSDADGKTIDEKKEYVSSKYAIYDKNQIHIVQYEIESWYAAGMTEVLKRKLSFKDRHWVSTDCITKEDFCHCIDSKSTKLFCMIEILKNYSVATAKTKNKSFSDFSNINLPIRLFE